MAVVGVRFLCRIDRVDLQGTPTFTPSETEIDVWNLDTSQMVCPVDGSHALFVVNLV